MNKILLVEEEMAIIQKSLERLTKAGFELMTARDGLSALQMARDKTPDLIIANSTIPGMNGYELCKAIRQDQETKSIPIAVMTEKHRMEDSFMFLGVKNFLNKPLDMDELESTAKRMLNFSQSMHLQKSKILIYGRPEVLSCCEQLLKHETHWKAFLANHNTSFLESAIQHAPDVILMDLMMPGAEVDEMIQKLKLVPELKNSVILTYYATAAMKQDAISIQAQMIEVQYMKMLAQEAGAREYLGAFNPVTFLNLINIYRKDFEI